jgi:type IV secretory pathway VirB10-like protein
MNLGDRLKKVKTGVGGVKTRSLVLVVLIIFMVVAFFTWTALRDTQGVLEGPSNTKRVKPIESLPGAGTPSVVYDPLQEEQNKEKAKAAEQSGNAAIPSLINQGAEGYGRGGFGNLGDNTGRCGDECYDQNGFDQQGFDKNGFDKDGFDRNGYDKDGYDRDGFDRQGYDRDGFNRKGCNRQGFNREGKPCTEGLFDQACFNAQGKDKNGCDREGKDAQGAVCYNTQGFNKAGFNKCGLNASGFDKDGFDSNGFDKDGFDRNGFDRNGCNREGKNRAGRACYNAQGFTEDGFDKKGYDPKGYDRNGLDKAGYDKNGYDKDGFDRMGFDKNGCNREGKNHQGKPCKAGTEAEIGNLLNGTSTGGEGGAPLSAQAQAAAQYERLLADQRAMQQAQLAALTAQQQQDLAAQQQAQIQAYEALMNTQAQALIAAWAPPTQAYIRGAKTEQKPATAAAAPLPGQLAAYGTGPVIYRAGDVIYAIIETSVNSDEPGPVMARIVSGPLKGSRVLGTFERQDKSLLLTFSTISIPDVPKSIDINGIAIDPETARTGLASDVDSHYLTKYVSVLAASFLQGMGQAVQTSIGTPQLSSSGSATIASTAAVTTQQQVTMGLGALGSQMAADVNKAGIQPTVTLNSGTGVGILIMADLRIEEPKEKTAVSTTTPAATIPGQAQSAAPAGGATTPASTPAAVVTAPAPVPVTGNTTNTNIATTP